MPRPKGFAKTRFVGDLFAKLQHDLQRMRNDPLDEDAAFDFFVTAEYMVDWHLPDLPAGHRRKETRSVQELRIATSAGLAYSQRR